MLLLHIDTLSALRKPFQICYRMGFSPPTCETAGCVFSLLKKVFRIFCRTRQPLVCENKPLAFSRRLPVFAVEWALAPNMWDNWMNLISPSLGVDATNKGFQDNKRSSFAKIGNFLRSFFDKITSIVWFTHSSVKKIGCHGSTSCHIIEILRC